AEDLTAQADAGEPAGCEHRLLGGGHLVGFAGDEFDTARCAASVAAASMELIDFCFVLEREHQTLALRHLEFAHTFDIQLRHDGSLIGSMHSRQLYRAQRSRS